MYSIATIRPRCGVARRPQRAGARRAQAVGIRHGAPRLEIQPGVSESRRSREANRKTLQSRRGARLASQTRARQAFMHAAPPIEDFSGAAPDGYKRDPWVDRENRGRARGKSCRSVAASPRWGKAHSQCEDRQTVDRIRSKVSPGTPWDWGSGRENNRTDTDTDSRKAVQTRSC